MFVSLIRRYKACRLCTEGAASRPRMKESWSFFKESFLESISSGIYCGLEAGSCSQEI